MSRSKAAEKASAERADRIQARDARRQMRRTKADLIGDMQDLGRQIEELGAYIEELEIRLDIDARKRGPIEFSIENAAAKISDPDDVVLAHIEIARNLGRILDKGGENERTAAAVAKQLAAELEILKASIAQKAAPKKGVAGLKAVS